MNLALDTWLISDTHFFHKNIVKYCNRPREHTWIIAHNWKTMVKPEDDILHLGDVFMGNSGEAKELIQTLPGNKYFIRGNHDGQSTFWYREAGFQFVGTSTNPLGSIFWTAPDGQIVLFSHYPDKYALKREHEWDINIHGHIHNNGYASPEYRSRDYRNISVEVVDYRPVRLRDVLYGDAYEASRSAKAWDGQTETEKEKKVHIPTANEIGYFGDLN
jgi:calcineurin-like phosphoesterase family protein